MVQTGQSRAIKYGMLLGILAGIGFCLLYRLPLFGYVYSLFTQSWLIFPVPIWFGFITLFAVIGGCIGLFMSKNSAPTNDNNLAELTEQV